MRSGAETKDYWSTAIYREIIPMERIVVTDSFADKNGNVVSSSNYGIKDFPRELEVIVTFEEIEDNKTKLILQHVGIPAKMKEECKIGWNESFDKLAIVLKAMHSHSI